jgi:hypothetical protein
MREEVTEDNEEKFLQKSRTQIKFPFAVFMILNHLFRGVAHSGENCIQKFCIGTAWKTKG